MQIQNLEVQLKQQQKQKDIQEIYIALIVNE